jgi:thiamine-phosphate pyrophosphorylase
LQARKLLGKKAIIGGTANSLEDINKLIELKVDYIGLGPYRFTSTKKKLSPVLGIDGVKTILLAAKSMIPVVVIGAIRPADVEEIILAGAHGIAVSSAINSSLEKEVLVKGFFELIQNNNII